MHKRKSNNQGVLDKAAYINVSKTQPHHISGGKKKKKAGAGGACAGKGGIHVRANKEVCRQRPLATYVCHNYHNCTTTSSTCSMLNIELTHLIGVPGAGC